MRTLISSLILCSSLSIALGGCGARGPLYMPNKSLTNELPASKPATNPVVTTPARADATESANTTTENVSVTSGKK